MSSSSVWTSANHLTRFATSRYCRSSHSCIQGCSQDQQWQDQDKTKTVALKTKTKTLALKTETKTKTLALKTKTKTKTVALKTKTKMLALLVNVYCHACPVETHEDATIAKDSLHWGGGCWNAVHRAQKMT